MTDISAPVDDISTSSISILSGDKPVRFVDTI